MTPSSSIVFAGEVYGEGAVGGGVHLQRRGPVVIALRNKLLGVVMTWASGSIPVPGVPVAAAQKWLLGRLETVRGVGIATTTRSGGTQSRRVAECRLAQATRTRHPLFSARRGAELLAQRSTNVGAVQARRGPHRRGYAVVIDTMFLSGGVDLGCESALRLDTASD